MSATQQFRIDQLWIDVDRPIQPRTVRGTLPRRPRADTADRQMELRMAPAGPVVAPEVATVTDVPALADTPQSAAVMPAPIPPARIAEAAPGPSAPPPFGAWLLEQANRRGTLGELAKAARLDRNFPRKGDADAVRARFNAAGADGDAFEALDDAERDYMRELWSS